MKMFRCNSCGYETASRKRIRKHIAEHKNIGEGCKYGVKSGNTKADYYEVFEK